MILKDQIAIIAGGSKGIGRAVSTRFAREGAKLAIVARDQAAIDAAVTEARREGAKAIGVQADCTKSAEVARAIQTVVSELGKPQILVNTVGRGVPELMVKTSDELFELMMDLNVRSTFLLSRAVAPLMMEQHQGRIIHTSSIGAKMPTPGLSIYDGCKAFVVAFTRDLAVELGRFGVNVNCVCPGHIPTEATQDVGRRLSEITGLDPVRMMEMISSRMAIPRFPGADDIAGLYVFLASAEASYMTGQAINYSCGLEMR